jgi:outer membrane lipoprotein carrier protein
LQPALAIKALQLLKRGGPLLAAALLCALAQAQSAVPSVKEVAQRVNRHYNSLQSLKAQFSESYQGLGIKRFESGTLYLKKPGRMKWEYTTPAGKVFVLDGKTAWFYSTGDPQVQRIPAKELDDLRSPLRFLLGHTELEKELNGLTLVPAGNGGFVLAGQPKGLESRVRRLSLSVTPDGAITGMEIEEMDGALTRFNFSAQQPNVALPSETFRFTLPKGVPVVDAAPPV